MASLRKTLPIPDGALVWSPKEATVPAPADVAPIAGLEKLAAMILKRLYLAGASIPKDTFRKLQIEGECLLGNEAASNATDFTRSVLDVLDVAGMRLRREKNVRHFVNSMVEYGLSSLLLFNSWPSGAVPFNGVVICATPSIRSELQGTLIAKENYPAIHWKQDSKGYNSADSHAIDIASRVLTLPVDQRYSSLDVDRLVAEVAQYFGLHHE